MQRALPVPRHGSKRGVSEVIAVVLLVVIAIALAVSLYLMSGKFMHTGTTVSVSNSLVQNAYTDNGADQVIVISSKVTSQTNKQLNLSSANVIITLSNGQTVSITLTPGAPSSGSGGITAQLLNPNPNTISINPGSSQTFEYSITAPSSAGISAITIQYTFKTPSGNLVTVSSNSLSISG